MNKKPILLIVLSLCLLLPAATLPAQAQQIGRIADAKLAFQDIMAIPEKTVPEYQPFNPGPINDHRSRTAG